MTYTAIMPCGREEWEHLLDGCGCEAWDDCACWANVTEHRRFAGCPTNE